MTNALFNSSILADITYTVNTSETLINETFTTGADARLNTGTYEQRRVSIQNGRVFPTPLSLETTGFQLIEPCLSGCHTHLLDVVCRDFAA